MCRARDEGCGNSTIGPWFVFDNNSCVEHAGQFVRDDARHTVSAATGSKRYDDGNGPFRVRSLRDHWNKAESSAN